MVDDLSDGRPASPGAVGAAGGEGAARAGARRAGGLARRLLGDPLSCVGIAIILALGAASVAPGAFTRRDPLGMNPGVRLRAPSREFPLGTDERGRDILTRIIHGARLTLTLSILAVLLAAGIGTVLGLTAGYAAGWPDQVIMRVTDMFLAFPQLILAMAMVAALGPGLLHSMLGLGLVLWTQYARLVRAQVLQTRQQEYVQAAHALGARAPVIIVRHILPSCVSPLAVKATLDVGLAIIFLSSLSFIGLGAEPPTPEWGAMISSGREFLLDYWWVPTFPGLAIFVSVMAFNFFGDALRDTLDPKLVR